MSVFVMNCSLVCDGMFLGSVIRESSVGLLLHLPVCISSFVLLFMVKWGFLLLRLPLVFCCNLSKKYEYYGDGDLRAVEVLRYSKSQWITHTFINLLFTKHLVVEKKPNMKFMRIEKNDLSALNELLNSSQSHAKLSW